MPLLVVILSIVALIMNFTLLGNFNKNYDLYRVTSYLQDPAIAAIDKGRKGECYILGNEPVSFRDFSKMISDEAGCKPVKMFLPIWAANLMGRAMETMGKIRGTKPLMTTFSVYNLARNNAFDSSKAKKELGYHTRSYRETIHDEVEWLKAAGKIA